MSMHDKILDALNWYVDYDCELYGVRQVIRRFLDLGVDKETLIEMSFDESEIDIVLEDYYD